jgi:hypothetical protein
MTTPKFTSEQADRTITIIMNAASELERKNYFGNENAIKPRRETAQLIKFLRNQLKDQSPGRIQERLSRFEPKPDFISPLDEQEYNNTVSELQLSGFFKLIKLERRYAAKNNNADLLQIIETSLDEIETLSKVNDDFVLSLRDL